MARIFPLAAILAMLVPLVAKGANDDEESPERFISVAATGKVSVPPDLVVWNITVSTQDDELQQAKAANDEQVSAVLNLAEQMGIAEKDVQTGYLQIDKVYERDQFGNRRGFRHFNVTRIVTIKQRDLERFEEFLTQLVNRAQIEANFHFDLSQESDARLRARLEAVQLAKNRAQAMTEVLGVELGRVLTIEEQRLDEPGPPIPMARMAMAEAAPGGGGTFEPGLIDVEATVYVKFGLE